MAKEHKAADGGPAEPQPAPVSDGRKTVDEWAVAKGYADVTAPHPHYAHRGWVIKTVDVGPSKRSDFAFAKAYFRWAIGKLMTEAEFDAAMDEVKGRKFGEHPVKG